MLGFVVGWMIITKGEDIFNQIVGGAFGPLVKIISGVLAVILWMLLLVGPLDSVLSAIAPIALMPVESGKLGGFMLSLIIGFTGIAASSSSSVAPPRPPAEKEGSATKTHST